MDKESVNDVEIVDAPNKLDIISSEIKQHAIKVEAHFIEIGKLLNHAKSLVDHGFWLTWLDENTDIPRSVASRLMRLAKEFPNVPPVAHLGFTKALLLLEVPADKRDVFIKKSHLVGRESKRVIEMSKRELQNLIRIQYKPQVKSKNTKPIVNSTSLRDYLEGLMICLDESNFDISGHAAELHKLSEKLSRVLGTESDNQ